jgi:hypothetical protein
MGKIRRGERRTRTRRKRRRGGDISSWFRSKPKLKPIDETTRLDVPKPTIDNNAILAKLDRLREERNNEAPVATKYVSSSVSESKINDGYKSYALLICDEYKELYDSVVRKNRQENFILLFRDLYEFIQSGKTVLDTSTVTSNVGCDQTRDVTIPKPPAECDDPCKIGHKFPFEIITNLSSLTPFSCNVRSKALTLYQAYQEFMNEFNREEQELQREALNEERKREVNARINGSTQVYVLPPGTGKHPFELRKQEQEAGRKTKKRRFTRRKTNRR